MTTKTKQSLPPKKGKSLPTIYNYIDFNAEYQRKRQFFTPDKIVHQPWITEDKIEN